MGLPVQLRSIPLSKHWPEDALKKRYEADPRSFDRGFRLRSYTDDELTFPNYPKCREPGIVLGDLRNRREWPSVLGIDLSSKKRPGNAVSVIRVDPERGYRYPVDIAFLAKPGPQVCDAIQRFDELYNPVIIVVEDNSYQDTLFDWVGDQKSRFKFWVKVEPVTTTSGRKGNPTTGLPGLEIEFKNGAWKFPLDEFDGILPDDESVDIKKRWWARLDREFQGHPIAVSSDGVMSTWFGRQGIEMVGLNRVTRRVSGVGDINAR